MTEFICPECGTPCSYERHPTNASRAIAIARPVASVAGAAGLIAATIAFRRRAPLIIALTARLARPVGKVLDRKMNDLNKYASSLEDVYWHCTDETCARVWPDEPPS